MEPSELFVGWGPVVPGHEQNSVKVFGEAMQFYMQAQQQGRIDRFEVFGLEPHGGDLAGFFLLRGDSQKLEQFRYSDDFLRILQRAQTVVQSIGVVSAFSGQQLQQYLQGFLQNTSDLIGG